MKNQPITSKSTSINCSHLPRVYNLIDWRQLKHDKIREENAFKGDEKFNEQLVVYDYGCGRYPEPIGDFLKTFGIKYFGYDPYWYPEGYRNYPEEGYGWESADVFVCSNVLNVICDWTEIKRISQLLRNQGKPWLITCYSGDNSYIGHETKKDCWQWNKPIECYLMSCSDVIKKKIITKKGFESYII